MSIGSETFAKDLTNLRALIGKMKESQGADTAWLIQMENLVLQKQMQPIHDLQNGGNLPQPGMNPQQGPMGGPMGPGGPMQGGMPGQGMPPQLTPGLNQMGGGVPGGMPGSMIPPQRADTMQMMLTRAQDRGELARMMSRGAPGLGH